MVGQGHIKLMPTPTVRIARGSVQMEVLWIPFPQKPAKPLTATDRPPLATAYRIEVNYPPNYPPEACSQLANEVARFERELARRLGYKVPQRMRGSKLSGMGKTLRVYEETLNSGDIYGIMDELQGEGDLADDQRVRSRTKTQRHRARNRRSGPLEARQERQDKD